ncbi:MAG TPA: ubiquinone biosynthesis protein [Nitrosospira sp.]|nr:ubiquinone biosynthesis protein [Nitrosospira sp.]
MLESVAAALLNHLLRGESWARKRLQPYAGKTARFCLPPFPDLVLIVQATGELSPATGDRVDDTVLIAAPGLLPGLLSGDERAYRKIYISGDREFAEEILHTGRNLNCDAEQELSHLMGDILAHRVVQSGRNLVHWHADTIRNLSQALMDYWTEEHPVLAKPAHLRNFIREVESLQDKTAYLEKRVNALIVQ